jgi:hypothetical protein
MILEGLYGESDHVPTGIYIPIDTAQPSCLVLRHLLKNTNMNDTVKKSNFFEIRLKTKDYIPHA